MINGYTQGLKDPRRRVYCPRLKMYARRHNCRQPRGTGNRATCTLIDDTAGDLARASLLTIAPEYIGQFLLSGSIHQIARRKGQRWIEPHIDRAIGTEGESPLGIIHLIRREAQIEQDSLYRAKILHGCYVSQLRKILLNDR